METLHSVARSEPQVHDEQHTEYCGIPTNCSANVTCARCDGLEQLKRVFEIWVTM